MRPLLFLTLLSIIALTACQDKYTYEAEDVDTQTVDSLNQEALDKKDTGVNSLAATSAPPALWNTFMRTYRDCFQNKAFTNGITYLGPDNSKYVGAILSRDQQITWKTTEKTFRGMESELNKFIQEGNPAPANCDKNQLLNTYFDVIASGSYNQTASADLSAAIEKKRSIRMLTGRWRTDELVLGDFYTYLDTSTNLAVKDYKEYLEKNRLLLTKILIIENFTAEIETSDSLSAKLKAQLATGINTTLIADKQAADSVNGNLKMSFSHGSNNSIKVSAVGKSYAIGMLQKINKIKRK